jgi:Big-like domain-containing protein
MTHTTSLFVRPALALLLAGSVGCGSSDLLLPEPPGGGDNVALSKYHGDEQIGTVGEQLPFPLEVRVLTARELPAAGREIAFAVSDPASGQVSPAVAITNADGVATARWVLGTTAGPHVVTAQLVGGEAENQVTEFSAAANPAAPDTLRATSDLTRAGRRGREVDPAPVVHVVDRFGNPVQNVQVVWQVAAGEGQVLEPITVTDASGDASAHWTLGNRIGVHRLTASVGTVSGSPVTFLASVFF